jgi:hypothetical protein
VLVAETRELYRAGVLRVIRWQFGELDFQLEFSPPIEVILI